MPFWPSSLSVRSSVCCARNSTEVNAMSNDSPCAFSLRPASLASAMPCSVRSGSFQPVNRFFRFHSLWPWRTSTRSRSLIFVIPFLEVLKPEHVGHRVKPRLLVARPKGGLDGALREHGAVLGAVRQLDTRQRACKNPAVLAGNGTAAQRRKADIARPPRAGVAVAAARRVLVEDDAAARRGGPSHKVGGATGGLRL